jgi:hypothetical protein
VVERRHDGGLACAAATWEARRVRRPLLESLDEAPQKQAFMTMARRRTFSPGEVVVHRDDPADTMHRTALDPERERGVHGKTQTTTTRTRGRPLSGDYRGIPPFQPARPRSDPSQAQIEDRQPTENHEIQQLLGIADNGETRTRNRGHHDFQTVARDSRTPAKVLQRHGFEQHGA